MSAPLWLEKINKAKESQSNFLDIGKCGLSELPEELFSNPEFCKQVEILIAGNSLIQKNDATIQSENTWHSNSISIIDERIVLFENLRELSFLGNAIEDAEEIKKLSRLQKLEILDIGGNKLSILPPLNALAALHTLRVSNNQLKTVTGINKLKKLSFLYLGWNNLETIPPEINELTALQFLFLGNNKISSIENIHLLKKLKRLYVDNNNISTLQNLNQLGELEILNISKNNITIIEGLDACIALEKLCLSNNQIEVISNLDNLKNLTTLELDKNKIAEIKGIEQLTSLETLVLSNNNLSQISGLDKNINLQKLTLNNNQLNTLKNISHLTQLKYLSASDNHISDCSELENMLQLESIILDFNTINDITPLLPHIKNGLRVSPINSSQKTSTGDIHLLGNPINTPPIEIMNQGNEAIIAHFDEMEAADSMEINEAKLLILGAGGVGKTTLATKLKNANGAIPQSEDTTIGINISIQMLPVAVDGRDYGIHIWDFGGQDIYHSTHQFFLTKRSFYILVEDGREQKNVMNYWLHVQELLSENSPMLLLQNLKAGSRRDIDIPTLKNNFQNLKEYIEVNLKEPSEIPAIWNLIKSQIMLMPHFGERISKRWLGIRREIENYAITTDYIPLTVFRNICVKHGISHTKRQDILLAYLNDLGVLLHFIDIPELRRFIVIKPQWVTDAVYKILDHTKRQTIQGCFNWEDLEQVWNVKQYENMFPQLLSLMQKFELSYELPDKPKTYIAPLLLPESRPADLAWDDMDNLQLNYQYDFMPEGILPRLVVRIHSLIKNQEYVWKRGAVFTWDNTDAFVIDNTLMRKIEIKVKGKEVKGLISIIIKELDEINEGFYFTQKRGVRKMVPCICSQCKISTQPYFHRYEILQRWAIELKRDKKPCDNSGEDVSIAEMLNNVFAENHLNADKQHPSNIETKVKNILMILANPVGTQALTIYEEFKQIKQELALSINKQNFNLIDAPEANLKDITRSFTQNPTVVHFCGHGEGEDGIIINDMQDGTKHYLTNEQLTLLFLARKESIECAVFSACKSEVQAELLSRQGIYVIGTSDKIENRTSILFSTGFYQSVYAGDNYEKAFITGKSLAMGENKFEAQKFVLYKNGRKII